MKLKQFLDLLKEAIESNAQKAENKPWYMKLLESISIEVSHTDEVHVEDSRIAELEKRLEDLKTPPSSPVAEKAEGIKCTK
jgi:polyhydroxyalkanoate synthesis regulator phasin